MARRAPSPAETRLAEKVSAHIGRDVTPHQIERWRQAGYVRSLDHTYLGRHGTGSSFDQRLVREVAAFAARSDGRTPLHEVALAVFVNGEEIGEEAVRRAYHAYLDVSERFLRGRSTEDALEAGQTAAPVMVRRFLRTKDGRRWKRRLAAAGYDAEPALERVVAELFAVMLGGPPSSEEAVRAFLEASGLAAAERERFGKLAPWAASLPVSQIASTLPSFSIPALHELVDRTSYRDLCRARTAARKIVSLLNAVAPVVTRIVPTRDALGFAEMTHVDLERQLPLLTLAVRIFEERGYGIKRVVRLAERSIPLYRALRVLLDAMPRRLARFASPDGIERLNTRPYPERIEFVQQLKAAITKHPEETQIVGRSAKPRRRERELHSIEASQAVVADPPPTEQAATFPSMPDRTWPILIRYSLRERPSLGLDLDAYWDTHGVILRDGGGAEHHFGLPEVAGSEAVFTWVASYDEDGREDWPGDVHDRLTGLGYQLADPPTLGPKVSPLVEVALDGLCEFAGRKGFAFDEERTAAVRTFGALMRAGESYDIDEVYVYGATNGFHRPKDAEHLKDYAQRAMTGKQTRSVNGYAIRVDPAQADKMIEYWRQKLAEQR